MRLLVLAVGLAACGGASSALPQTDSFAGLFASLSEPGGFFDTDNVISNERSYLHVIDELERRGVTGGAYIGVGPDQNFSYIVAIRPVVAYIVDIRRDNALEHFIFKALFALSPTPIEYLSALFGRPPPPDPPQWVDRDIAILMAYVDTAQAGSRYVTDLRRRVDSVIGTFGIPLTDDDWAAIDRFHRTFIANGLDLQFRTFGRAPRSYYPSYRDLLLETTTSGRSANFLVDPEAYEFLRGLQANDRVIPVVGNFAGPHAFRAVASDIERRGLTVSALYTSNVEFYLYNDGSMSRFVDNVADLPTTHVSVVIRSLFLSSYPYRHSAAIPGFASVQLLQPIDRMVEGYRRGAFPRYWDLVR